MNIQNVIWRSYKNRLRREKQDFLLEITNFIPGILTFVATSRCNFTCKHCLRNLECAKDLPLETVEKALKGAKKYNFKFACLTGGEPLLYPYLKEAIDLFAKYKYSFSLISNGYDFKKYADLLSRHKNNINFVAFSLESTDKKKHDAIRREGSFDKLLENCSICKKTGIPFRFITSASPANFDELFNIAVFAKKKGAQASVMTTVLPCPRSKDNRMILRPEDRQELFVLLRQLSKTLKYPILTCADIRASNNIKLCNPLDLKEITIDADSNLMQCCELSNFDDENIRKNATITNLKENSFDDALKIISAHIHNFNCSRIEDYKQQNNTEGIDFNSCFYCVNKLSL